MTSQTSFCFAEIGLVTERWRLRLSTEGCIAIGTLSRRRAWILRSSRWRDCHTNSSVVRDAAIARRERMVLGRPHGAVALIAERQNAVHRDGGTRLHPRAHGAACVGREAVSLLSCSVAPFLIL